MKRISRQAFCVLLALGIGLTSYAHAQAPATPDTRQDRFRSRQATSSTSTTPQPSMGRSSSPDVPISDTPKPMLALTIWAITLVEPTGRPEEDLKAKSNEQLTSPPPEFNSLTEVRDFVEQM